MVRHHIHDQVVWGLQRISKEVISHLRSRHHLCQPSVLIPHNINIPSHHSETTISIWHDPPPKIVIRQTVFQHLHSPPNYRNDPRDHPSHLSTQVALGVHPHPTSIKSKPTSPEEENSILLSP